jgi:putative ABC transport system ATP-binding protein
MARIETHDLHKTYHTRQLHTPVLHGIDLSIETGEFIAIMGPSGCGKSTLLYVLGLMARYDFGTVLIDGQDVAELSDAQKTRLRARRMGFVFQRFNLLPALSAEDNVAMALRLMGETNEQPVRDMITRVGLGEKRLRRPGALSIGEQQRVAIARSMVGRPDILFADEPTGNLDSENSEKILELLKQFNREMNQTILMVTHDDDAARWADRTIHMKDGRLVNGQQ